MESPWRPVHAGPICAWANAKNIIVCVSHRIVARGPGENVEASSGGRLQGIEHDSALWSLGPPVRARPSSQLEHRTFKAAVCVRIAEGLANAQHGKLPEGSAGGNRGADP